jgi:predicted TIM-barrel fold metal-dependent hydrolase
MAFETKIGVAHVCVVSVSTYGDDNRHMIEALEQLQGRGRGVAVVNIDSVSDAELDSMHAVGVRGLRFNLHTLREEIDRETFKTALHKYADKIRRHDWVIQLFVQMHQISLIADEIPKLGVDVVLDHLGAPTDPTVAVQEQPGYAELMALLRARQVYVKLSGVYRFSGDNMPGLDDYCREVLRDAPTQVVWGSDRPHPTGPDKFTTPEERLIPQDYQIIDIPAFIAKCKEWCDYDGKKIKMIFVDNPRRLWRYDRDD